MTIEMEIDRNKQWFTFIWVKLGERSALVRFKLDTGCNSLVISHKTLAALGYSASKDSLAKLPSIEGVLASGEKHIFKKLGKIDLYKDQHISLQICKTDAICHETHETHDLLGTEVLQQFSDIRLRLLGNKFIELVRS